jgi:hypothetical protein
MQSSLTLARVTQGLSRNSQLPQETHYHQAPVVHTCNPSYSGGRDQEDHVSKPAQANSSQDLFLGNVDSNMYGYIFRDERQIMDGWMDRWIDRR